MNRRRLLALAIGAGMAGHAALLRAQSSTVAIRRVGVLAPSTRAKEEVTLKPFFDEMRKLGWIEAENIAYDRAYADDQSQTLPRLAAELVARRPEVIYAPPPSAAVAAKRATNSIPIVFATGADPVGAGLVMSLSNPRSNATGFTTIIDTLAPKKLEVLREIMPGMKRLGLIGDPNDPRLAVDRAALTQVAASLGVELVVVEALNPAGFDAGVASLVAQRVDAIMAVGSLATNLPKRLLEPTIRQLVPVVGTTSGMVEAGALFSYGASVADHIRRSALLVDKILKGAKPADIPVEQPTEFELVVNLKTAKALGIKIPESVLLRANRVIE